MKRFIVTFTVVLLGLFTLELTAPVKAHLIDPWTGLLARITVWIIKIFDSQAMATGNVIQDLASGFGVAIEAGCNGVEAVIILLAAILAFPAPMPYRLKGILLGMAAIMLLNVARIITLFYLGKWDMAIFEWAHLYVWPVLIILDALVVFMLWTHFAPRSATGKVSS